METNRLFIASEIENFSCKSFLIELQKLIPDSGVKKPSIDNLHLTLKFLGNVPIDAISNIRNSLKTIQFNSFRIVFTSIGAFPSKNYPRVLWAGISDGSKDLIELVNQIENKMEKLGFKKENRPFKSHLTLARVKKQIKNSNLALSKFFNQEMDQIELDNKSSNITKFILKKSTLTPKGPIYEDLNIFKSKNL